MIDKRHMNTDKIFERKKKKGYELIEYLLNRSNNQSITTYLSLQ